MDNQRRGGGVARREAGGNGSPPSAGGSRHRQQPRQRSHGGRPARRSRRGRPRARPNRTARAHQGAPEDRRPQMDHLISGETSFPSAFGGSDILSDAATHDSGSDIDDLDSGEAGSLKHREIHIDAANDALSMERAHAAVAVAAAASIPKNQHQDDSKQDDEEGSTKKMDPIQEGPIESSTSNSTSEDKKPKAKPREDESSDTVRKISVADAEALLDQHEGSTAVIAQAASGLSLEQRRHHPQQQNQEEVQQGEQEEEKQPALPLLEPAQEEEDELKAESVSSLEVEVNSSGSQSLLSHDDQSTESPLVGANDDDEGSASGRRSPGGTLYVGRGSRRYQGRYMNLALRRFHQDGVHPDSLHDGNDDGTFTSSQHVYDERQNLLRQRSQRRDNNDNERQPHPNDRDRSRSRSRSPDRSSLADRGAGSRR